MIGRSRSHGAGRSGPARRHGCRTSGRDSARSWPSIRCASPAVPAPRASPSPAPRPNSSSTARSRMDCACAPPPPPVHRRDCSRGRAPTARRSRGIDDTSNSTSPTFAPPHRRGLDATSLPIRLCMPSILSVARGCTFGSRQPSAVTSFWYCVRGRLGNAPDRLVQRQVRESPAPPVR